MRQFFHVITVACTSFATAYACSSPRDSSPSGDAGAGGDQSSGGTGTGGAGRSAGASGRAGADPQGGEGGVGDARGGTAGRGGASGGAGKGGKGGSGGSAGESDGGEAGSDLGASGAAGEGADPGEHEVLWSDDFEGGLGEWSVEGGTWAVGSQVYNTEPIPVSGTQHAGTVIGGEYGTGRDARLISPELTVPSASQGPRFRFAYWYQFAAGDYGRVQVRTLGGDWEDAPGAALTNDAAGWAQSIVDLRKYAGSVVQIALRFVSDDQHAPRWGWYVDDAAFEVGRRPLGDLDDFESGFGDWSVEGGAWARSIQRFNTEPVAPSGTNYVGTAPGSEYGINTDARLISPEYPVPPASAAPKFRFSYWYQFGAGDYGQVQLRVLGDDWQDVAGGRIEQENGSWSQQVVDLRPYAGQTVQIGLRFVSDDQHTPRWGWYVDDAGFESR